MAPPKLTPEQRAKALEKAVEVRRKRAEIKTLLKNGSLSLDDLLDRAADDSTVSAIKVSVVLSSMPRIGKVRAAQIMEELGIAENRRIQGLGPNQRASLLDKFGS
ncbi:MAG: 30S ribosomal protein S13 [Acidimicrobiia bacterium]|nr:integration host factor, actinobacterial type [bacterium]MXX64042.1 30S ribosomal protein S13 [Acidimicrobiia bacterium]MCY3579080.1 integration host factor, actinobacterial type [bacterium]MCY3653220.1 integration host factor, actinobacterial type [bacterium]MDE0642787.1 integration host factor, actinobacterial type [bacterium]